MWACWMVWKSEAYQNLLVWAPSLPFLNSHPDISLSQPRTLLLAVQLTPVSVGSRCTQPPPPLLPPPAKPVLHFMPPSHHYLHICQHPLCGQEATALLQRVCDGGRGGVYVSDARLSQAPSMCFVNKAQRRSVYCTSHTRQSRLIRKRRDPVEPC